MKLPVEIETESGTPIYVQLHEQIWKVRLIDPAGGRYTWNAKWQTMESSVYGHPGKPQKGPAAPPLVAGITGGNFGLTFENDGLRTQVVLHRKPKVTLSRHQSSQNQRQ